MDGAIPCDGSNDRNSQKEDTFILPPATKRGKGTCPGQNCEYSYACRKKPSTCPKCGYYLGGTASDSVKEDTSVCFATKLKVGDLPDNYELYSVKISRRGRDYRCFVQVSTVNNLHICYYEKCRIQRSATIISNSDSFLCEHVKTAKESTMESEVMPILQNALPALPFPSSMKEELREYLEKASAKNTPPIQHVSVNNYVLVCERSHRNPLGLVHLRVDDKKNKFSCGVDGSRTATKPYRSKCVHYCLYGWATLDAQQSILTPITDTQSTSQMHCSGTQESLDNASVEILQTVSAPTNKTIQRNSTVELLKKTVKIPEDTIALQPIFKLIESRNAATTTLLDIMRSRKRIELHFNEIAWKTSFEPEEQQCLLCSSELSDPLNVQGSNGEGWLVTMTHILPITCKVKKCSNSNCMAIHSYHDVHSGLFNIANKILVSIDLLFLIREHVKQGVLPLHAVEAIMSMTLAKSPAAALKICGEKRRYIEQHLFKGYWAYECLTVRNYDDAICGLCGVAPKLEVGESSHRETMSLSGVKIDWTPSESENAVDVDSFWMDMENKSLEQAAFASVDPVIHYEGTKIAPFIPPAHRADTVINTEHLKVSAKHIQNVFQGNTSKVASLVQRGVITPLSLTQYSHNDLFSLCQRCDIPVNETDSKATLESYLESGYNLLISGRSRCHSFSTGPAYNGGKVYKACPHQVITASKYTVRPETARDHVDLLRSSKYWPPVYLTDLACTVAQHADVRYPELTTQLWHNKQGCFETPSSYEHPQPTSCPDLQMTELQSTPTLLVDSDEPHVHPTTGTKERRILTARYFDKTFSHQLKSCEYHNIDLCPELSPYKGCIVQPRHGQRAKDVKRKSTASLSFHHYFLYGRLQDYFANLATVKQQLELISKQCNEGQTIVRDKFQRFVIVCSKCYYGGHVAKSCPYNT